MSDPHREGIRGPLWNYLRAEGRGDGGALKDQRTYINTSGNSAMAKAGSGDVLTGIIAGLIAIGMDEEEAACLGVYLHGRAGDAAASKSGAHSLLASELADAVGSVMAMV